MKKLVSVVVIAASLVVAASCHNSSSAETNIPAKKMAMPMAKDTAKFNANMMDNKKDFVCHMPLTAGIGDTVHYKGKVYGFCSKECKESFLKDPKSYLKEKL